MSISIRERSLRGLLAIYRSTLMVAMKEDDYESFPGVGPRARIGVWPGGSSSPVTVVEDAYGDPPGIKFMDPSDSVWLTIRRD